MDFGSSFVFSPEGETEEYVEEINPHDLTRDIRLDGMLSSENVISEQKDDHLVTINSESRGTTKPLLDGFFQTIRNSFSKLSFVSIPRQSSEETASQETTSQVPPQAAPRSQFHANRFKQRGDKVFRRKVGTNIISLTLSCLADEAPVSTGDAQFCEKCGACLNSISIVKRQNESENNSDKKNNDNDDNGEEMDKEILWDWKCEFCYHNNSNLSLEPEEIPQKDVKSLDYILTPATTTSKQSNVNEEGIIVFLVDTSGSMCVTTPVQGKIQLKGAEQRQKSLRSLRTNGDDHNQYFPNEQRNVTYISRIQAVQAAVDAQLDLISEIYPDKKIALITFSGEVLIIGDAVSILDGQKSVIRGERLNSFDEIIAVGREHSPNVPIKNSKKFLKERLFGLEESGSTALGPAVTAALGMVENRRGSKIVVCTDGLANTGLGGLDRLTTDEDFENARLFYNRLGTLAQSQGIMIDIIGIDGDGCDIENLSIMSELTGGNVTLVNTLNLTSNFTGILANPVTATEVSIKILLNAGLEFRDEFGNTKSSTEPDENTNIWAGSSQEMILGNATNDTELTFEYDTKPYSIRRKIGVEKENELPFQVQIRYTKLDGMRCIRVITETRPVTSNRQLAEQHITTAVVGTHAAQQCARLAKEGAYEETRASARAWSNIMQRNVTTKDMPSYTSFLHEVNELDEQLDLALDDEDLCIPTNSSNRENSFEKKKYRQQKRSKTDQLSNKLSQLKKTSHSKNFQTTPIRTETNSRISEGRVDDRSVHSENDDDEQIR